MRFFEQVDEIQPGNRHVLVVVGLAGSPASYSSLPEVYQNRFKFINIARKTKIRTTAPCSIDWDEYSWDEVFADIEEWVSTATAPPQ